MLGSWFNKSQCHFFFFFKRISEIVSASPQRDIERAHDRGEVSPLQIPWVYSVKDQEELSHAKKPSDALP